MVRFAPKSDKTLIGMNADRDTAYVGIYVLGSVRHRRQIPIAEAVEKIFLKHGGRPHWGKYRYLTSRSTRRRTRLLTTDLQAFEAVREQARSNGMFSAKRDMFDDLDRFERPPIGEMIKSVFGSEDYWQIGCCKGVAAVRIPISAAEARAEPRQSAIYSRQQRRRR